MGAIMLNNLNDFYRNTKAIKNNALKQKSNLEEEILSAQKKLKLTKAKKKKLNNLLEKMSKSIKEKFPELENIDNSSYRTETQNQINQFFLEEGFIVEIEDNDEIDSKFVEYSENFSELKYNHKYVLNNCIVNMVMEFEGLISSLFEEYYSTCDQKQFDNKSLTIDELRQFDSMQDAINHIINQEIISILYGSSDKWINNIRDKLKLDVDYYRRNQIDIREIFQRRNIIIHNKSIVNSTYISKSENPFKLEVNTDMISTVEYVENAYYLLLTLAVLIIISFWNNHDDPEKTAPDVENVDHDTIDSTLQNIAFDLLSKEKWIFAYEIYNSLQNSKHAKTYTKKMYLLNILLCKKMMNIEGVDKEIKDLDYTSNDVFLQAGANALKMNYTALKKNMKDIPDDSIITKKQLETWPIFKLIRDNKDEFQKVLDSVKPYKEKKYVLNLN